MAKLLAPPNSDTVWRDQMWIRVCEFFAGKLTIQSGRVCKMDPKKVDGQHDRFLSIMSSLLIYFEVIWGPEGGNVLLRCYPQVIYMTCHKSLVACGVLGKNDMMILWCIDVVEPSMPFLDWMIIFNPQPVLLWPNLNGGGGRWERACILWGGSRSSKGFFFFLPFWFKFT